MVEGSNVKVLHPFNEVFPDEYKIVSVRLADDGQTVYFLEGVFGAFSSTYLEEAK